MRKLLFLASPLLLFLTSIWVEAAGGGVITGERVSFSQAPRWTNSGVWDDSGRLVIVDVLMSRLLMYGADGKLIREIPDQGFALPALIHRAGPGSFWVEAEDGRLVRLDEKFRPEESILDLTKKVSSPKGSLISVSGWVPLNDSEVLVFGDMEGAQGARGVVVRVPLARPEAFKVLQEIDIASIAHRFFLLGQPYLAAVEGSPYFLLMGDTPRIVDGDQPGFRLVRSSGQALGPPDLPERITMSTTKAFFEKLASSSSPAGIYGWRGSLYVLMRWANAKGARTWNLLKINPETNKIVWNRPIDTDAAHLLVVPGDKYWAFVEKGPVKGAANQEIKSFLRVPSEELSQ